MRFLASIAIGVCGWEKPRGHWVNTDKQWDEETLRMVLQSMFKDYHLVRHHSPKKSWKVLAYAGELIKQSGEPPWTWTVASYCPCMVWKSILNQYHTTFCYLCISKSMSFMSLTLLIVGLFLAGIFATCVLLCKIVCVVCNIHSLSLHTNS